MTLQLDLKPETEQSLRAAAEARQIPVEEYVQLLLERRTDDGIRHALNPALTDEEFNQWLKNLSRHSDKIPHYPERFWTRDILSDDDRG